MSFWQFGRDPADVEIATRVITAATQNGYSIRGKLTLHFAEPQRQADADATADRVAQIAASLLREAQSHERVIGAEAQISAALFVRYPADVARARVVEVAALHVVGDPTLSEELRRASSGTTASFAAVKPTPTPPGGALASPVSVARLPLPGAGGPPGAQVTPQAPPVQPFSAPPTSKRRGSSQLRSIQSLLIPPGTPPGGMAAFIAPMARDAAARLLIGYLRAHDLITLRGVAIDEGSAEALASLVPVSDAPPGGYEASRASELARWQGTLGADVVTGLHRETSAVTTYLMREAILREDVPRALAIPVVEALCTTAFPSFSGLLAELDRFPEAKSPELVSTAAERLSEIADAGDDPMTMQAALTPLIAVIQEDLYVSAMIIKLSSS